MWVHEISFNSSADLNDAWSVPKRLLWELTERKTIENLDTSDAVKENRENGNVAIIQACSLAVVQVEEMVFEPLKSYTESQ